MRLEKDTLEKLFREQAERNETLISLNRSGNQLSMYNCILFNFLNIEKKDFEKAVSFFLLLTYSYAKNKIQKTYLLVFLQNNLIHLKLLFINFL